MDLRWLRRNKVTLPTNRQCECYAQCYGTAVHASYRTDEINRLTDQVRALEADLAAVRAADVPHSPDAALAVALERVKKSVRNEEIQRHANDHLEDENSRLRKIVAAAGLEYEARNAPSDGSL